MIVDALNKTVQSSLVPNAWANQMSVKIASVPDCVFVPTWGLLHKTFNREKLWLF